ncbi:MAG TPA: TspO/MBR family protein [Longimicrobiales bacterium]|nr:TspO/MBR family protein [Longimicrobiales bacterium]
MKSLVALVVSFVVCFAAAAIGGLATRRAPEFYEALSQPSWAPPASLFGPVWTVLYALMAIAVWLVWKERSAAGAGTALTLFLVQLALNALWSWLFFAWQLGTAARVEIVVLLVVIALTIAAFWRVRPLAGALMLPYLAWVAYATALTFALVRQNPGIL